MAASVQFFYHFRVMLLNAENNNIMIGAYEANREIKTRFGTLRYTLRYIIMIVIIIIIIIITIIIILFRALFGPTDHEENLRFVRKELKKAKNEAANKW